MSKHKYDGSQPAPTDGDPPQLTTDGTRHPLQQGGYDPASDPQLPSNESDVAALKAGHATRKQAEAIARADAENGTDDESDDDDDAKADKKAKKKS